MDTDDLHGTHDKLKARIAVLENALKWYANEDNYLLYGFGDVGGAILTDEGQRARKALRARGKYKKRATDSSIPIT